MKTRTRRRQLLASVTSETEQPLSPARAFVVQFREEMNATPGRCCGRVEHIVSGHAIRFHSPEELWAFFTRIVADVQD